MKKSILAMALALCMAVTMLPGAALAANAKDDAELLAAIAAAVDGDTITLTDDVTLGAALEIDLDDVDLTLDLGTHTLYGRINLKGGRLTVTNGTIESTSSGIYVYANQNDTDPDMGLVVNADATIKGDYGVCLNHAAGKKAYNTTIDIYGTIDAKEAGVFILGNIEEGDSTVNIKSPAKITADANTTESCGVAINGNVAVTIEAGTEIEGQTGVEIRAGSLDVQGGKITGTGTPYSASGDNNGTTTIGAAIAVSSYNISDLDVKISGGEFYGENSLIEDFVNSGSLQKGISIEVAGGEFNGPVSAENTEGFIESGSFTDKPAQELLGNNLIALPSNDNGEEVFYVNSVAQGPAIHVTPLNIAFDAVDSGYTTVTAKNITITNNGDTPVSLSEASLTNFKVTMPGTVDLNPGDSVTMAIEPNGGLAANTYSEELLVKATYIPAATGSPSSPAPVEITADEPVVVSFVVNPVNNGNNGNNGGGNGNNNGGGHNHNHGNGIDVNYKGGNSFSTSNPAVPSRVEIDGVPVGFTGNGSFFTVNCINPGARWIKVCWNNTTSTTSFTPDAFATCTTMSIPKTGDASVICYAIMAIAAAAGVMRKK